MALDDDVKTRLDAVVGESYTPRRRTRELLAKWGGAAVLAVAAAALVMWTLHRYMTQAETAPAPTKPVQIRIVPAR